ncbi:uncharacterized protein TM35_000093450 [Trypanosoma theileri]|uniref:Uncharacterized protein n=1 Tax=Trypanosoma theileri TaxID=67003 RepID=A0A1X0P044_9TRYP|nr:uncharacterized protein TM35_000093450 [Trypanosoma theileri]ORC90295.1 hypothetical protein TM35_000093450 [Trypanosoma theileri]
MCSDMIVDFMFWFVYSVVDISKKSPPYRNLRYTAENLVFLSYLSFLSTRGNAKSKRIFVLVWVVLTVLFQISMVFFFADGSPSFSPLFFPLNFPCKHYIE